MAPACVVDVARSTGCRDTSAATHLKVISIVVIFLSSVLGISFPVLLARYFQGKPIYDKAILLIKCFAAGVILSTAVVHVLPGAYDAMLDCHVASMHPWRDFPFAGVLTLLGALLALFVDITATAHVEGGPGHGHGRGEYEVLEKVEMRESETRLDLGKDDSNSREIRHCNNVGGEYEALDLPKTRSDCDRPATLETSPEPLAQNPSLDLVKLKQRLVSQVLEIGIIFHSVIIGVTMGMSQNKCTIRPLVAALAFHQIFEGMGLGGCIAQAGFGSGTIAFMCFMFSVTTPMGIVLGMIVFSLTRYDDSNPNALIMEGLLGSLSSGILIYMGLVDLIAVDFFHNKLMSSTHLLKASFIALVIGSTTMSILALWA